MARPPYRQGDARSSLPPTVLSELQKLNATMKLIALLLAVVICISAFTASYVAQF